MHSSKFFATSKTFLLTSVDTLVPVPETETYSTAEAEDDDTGSSLGSLLLPPILKASGWSAIVLAPFSKALWVWAMYCSLEGATLSVVTERRPWLMSIPWDRSWDVFADVAVEMERDARIPPSGFIGS